MNWLAGTRNGLIGRDGQVRLEGREITALAPEEDGCVLLVDGREVIRLRGDHVETIASVDEETGRCVLAIHGGALVGTANARLAVVRPGSAEMLTAFDDADGRDGWYTPWGGPPDTRSLAGAPDGSIFANVHVGGILRAADPSGPWEPTIDVDADVHQVVADAGRAGHVVAATALGLAESVDGGASWRFSTDGLHAPYARAAALDGDVLYLSASTGPRGGRAAVYRRPADADVFEKFKDALPEWFGGNIDSHCLAAGGGAVAFATEDGRVFMSDDGGGSWDATDGLGRVRCVVLGASARVAT